MRAEQLIARFPQKFWAAAFVLSNLAKVKSSGRIPVGTRVLRTALSTENVDNLPLSQNCHIEQASFESAGLAKMVNWQSERH